jgi:23S rRNA (cytidine1920-2'-O)/16S rRNA (cytidine1409-2'-O)-methyltransferase
MDYRLRKDPRVTVMERTNARYPVSLPEKADLATIDVSFISLEKIIPSVVKMLKDGGYMVVLVKPQFEAMKKEVGRGGVIKQPEIHARVLGRFIDWLTDQGYRLRGLVTSPISGASGNREFLVLLEIT